MSHSDPQSDAPSKEFIDETIAFKAELSDLVAKHFGPATYYRIFLEIGEQGICIEFIPKTDELYNAYN